MTGLTLSNNAGLRWHISENNQGYAFGQIEIYGKLLSAPFSRGFFGLRNAVNGEQQWINAQDTITTDANEATFSGQAKIGQATLSFTIKASLIHGQKAACIEYTFSLDNELEGWEMVLAYPLDDHNPWKAQLYPFAQDAVSISEPKLTYIGVPSVLLYQEDFSQALLYGFDLEFDYLNPTTWSGETGFFYHAGAHPPQFRVSTDRFSPGAAHKIPLHAIFSDAGTFTTAIPELVSGWIEFNDYEVDPLYVRGVDEGLDLFLRGRLNTSMWKPEKGYKLEEGDPESDFIYLGEQPLSAYFEYLVYQKTGDPVWRQRAFEQMDFLLRAQNTEPVHPHYGAIHTAYDLPKAAFDSDDRGVNIGYKPDLNAYMARYMLQTWERVKTFEGVDRQEWYQAAVLAVDWVLRQANPDGGLPQKVDIDTGVKSRSVVSGRALPAIPIIYRITGNERYLEFAFQLERFLRRSAEEKLHFTGHHPDLPPDEIEEASVWGAVEYWLDKFELTGETECLERAIADAYLSFLWWCPKQLSWVTNPTQCASAEQQHFLQYSLYCYQNRKLQCLYRLWEHTGNELFRELFERITQGVLWTQVTRGDLIGATHERVADPWLARDDYGETPAFDSLGTVYMGEQSLDTMLQLVEMGLARPRTR
jgi:hypothetical protein